jgi:hypothetical protein
VIKKLKYKTKKELLEHIEVLSIDVHNLRQIINDQNETIMLLYMLVEDNIAGGEPDEEKK